jgi:hypothetical protein
VRRAYQTCTAVLERELGVAPGAATRTAYEQALQVDASGRQAGPPRVADAADAANTNLPVQLTNFVGCALERTAIRHLLRATRLLTLTGPGGTSKTRLALEAVAPLVDGYLLGVWLVELAALADPALVV